jgi:hypothetical protein
MAVLGLRTWLDALLLWPTARLCDEQHGDGSRGGAHRLRAAMLLGATRFMAIKACSAMG